MASVLKSEHGSALILALLMITLLALVGLWSTQTSVVETRISGNEKLHKIAFHKANGGTEAGLELVEQNIEERGFGDVCFRQGIGFPPVDPDSPGLCLASFYANADIGTQKPSCTNRDAFIPREADCTPPIKNLTNLRIGGSTTLSTGGAIQMIAGYEGKGKGSAGGGAWVTYDIRAQHLDADHSESVVNLRWRHVL